MKGNLPLSWSHKHIDSPRFRSVNLPLSGLPWVYRAEIPVNYEIEKLCNQLESEFHSGFLIRGCSAELANYLKNKGYDTIRTGAEGIVNLENLDKLPKSVIELACRGNKHGRVAEISLTKVNRNRVASFIENTPYALKPQLQYLFNNSFDSNSRCFAIEESTNKWLAVITISISGNNSCHIEMMLRDKNAPVGVMEYLILSVMNIYRDEGFQAFSLGEVPFITPEDMKETNIDTKTLQEHLLFKSGHFLKYAFNYQGLFDFKNKFNPDWEPVYICTSSSIPLLSLLDIFYKTGYFKLSQSGLLANIKNYASLQSIA